MDRAVARGLAFRSTEEVTRVALDEKSFSRSQAFVSVLTDHSPPRVLEVVPGRTTEAALALWASLPEPQRKKVEAASMDMGANFAAATRRTAPQAKIVHDRFNILQHLNQTVDQVRRAEHKRLSTECDNSLAGTKYDWLRRTSPEGERALAFDELCERELKSRIQAIKAAARGFRSYANYRPRILFFCGKLEPGPNLSALAASGATH